MLYDLLLSYMYIFHVKIQLLVIDGKVLSRSGSSWIRIGLAPWIRICTLIEVKKLDPDPHWNHCGTLTLVCRNTLYPVFIAYGTMFLVIRIFHSWDVMRRQSKVTFANTRCNFQEKYQYSSIQALQYLTHGDRKNVVVKLSCWVWKNLFPKRILY